MQEGALSKLSQAAVVGGDLVLAARCLGALSAFSPGAAGKTAELRHLPQEPTYALFTAEGRAGGVGLITTLYPR